MRGCSCAPIIRRSGRGSLTVLLALVLAGAAGCQPAGESPGQADGKGPGRRAQTLALTPNQELALGRQAFRELKSKKRVLPPGPELEQLRRVGRRITQAAEIEPLQRELNLRVGGFEWEFAVFEEDQINAFCLPGGKVGVFSGLLHRLKPSDDQLAAVVSHEIAHALAHHASERLARYQRQRGAVDDVLVGTLTDEVMGLLAAGTTLQSLAYDRYQESEADHIGAFLMTFADYDPREAIAFWTQMQQGTSGRSRPPEILSDHPSDARRIAQLRVWVPNALAAKRAYKGGRIAPPR